MKAKRGDIVEGRTKKKVDRSKNGRGGMRWRRVNKGEISEGER